MAKVSATDVEDERKQSNNQAGNCYAPAVTTARQRCRTPGDHGYDKVDVGNQLSHDTLARGCQLSLFLRYF